MKIHTRIQQLIATKKVTPYEISQQTGISEAALSRLLNGKTEKPNIKNINLLAKYFNVSLDWLRTGQGEQEKYNNNTTNNELTNQNSENNSTNHIAKSFITIIKEKDQQIANILEKKDEQMAKLLEKKDEQMVNMLEKKDEQIDRLITIIEKKEVQQQTSSKQILKINHPNSNK